MASVDESVTADGEAASLLAGLRMLSLDESVPFTQYIRYVLPLDGYVFWLKTAQVCVQGSLHQAANKQQLEDETIPISRVVFTTPEPVQQFNAIGPNTIWVGEFAGLKFAFSQQGQFYRSANLFHYSGNAVYPALESQLVDNGSQLPTTTLIVSNSLPAWLSLQSYTPQWLVVPNPGITLYPSFAVPANLQPPYGAVHIEPAETQPLSALPAIWTRGSHSQLASDRVRVTLYGLTNAQALAWQDLVNQYSYDTDNIGMMAPMIVRDQKRTQPELGILAMKKTVEYQVSYLQATLPNVARQLVTSVVNSYFPEI